MHYGEFAIRTYYLAVFIFAASGALFILLPFLLRDVRKKAKLVSIVLGSVIVILSILSASCFIVLNMILSEVKRMTGHWRKYGVLASMYLFIGAGIFYFFDGKAFPIVFLSMGFAFWISLAVWISWSKKSGSRRS